MGKNTAIVKVGRLVEIRASAGYRNAEEVDALFDQLEHEVAKLGPGTPHVTVVDWRRCPIMAPAAAERIGQRIAGTNATTERSAALARSDSPLAVLQFVRLIREAGLDDRKLFFDEVSLVAWLSEVLSNEESARLRAFLTEY